MERHDTRATNGHGLLWPTPTLASSTLANSTLARSHNYYLKKNLFINCNYDENKNHNHICNYDSNWKPPSPRTAILWTPPPLSDRPQFRSFCLSLGVFLWNFWWCFRRMCRFGLSDCRVKPRRLLGRNGGGRGAKFWAPHPSGPHPSAFGRFFWVWAPPFGTTMTHTRSRNGLSKNGLPKIGLAKLVLAQIGPAETKMAKYGLAKIGLLKFQGAAKTGES